MTTFLTSWSFGFARDWIWDIIQLLPSLEELRVWEDKGNFFRSSIGAISQDAGHALRRLVVISTSNSPWSFNFSTDFDLCLSRVEEIFTGFVSDPNAGDFLGILAYMKDIGTIDAATVEVARVVIRGSPMLCPVYSRTGKEHAAFLERTCEAQDLGIHVYLSFHDTRETRTWRRGARTPGLDVGLRLVDAAFTYANRRASEVEVELDGHDAWKLLRPTGDGAARLSKVTKLTVHIAGPMEATKIFKVHKSWGQVPMPELREVELRAPVGCAVFIPMKDVEELMTRFIDTTQSPRLNLIGVLISENPKP